MVYSFDLPEDAPIHSKDFRMPPRHIAAVKEEICNLLKAVVIKKSSSAYSFPSDITTGKDGKPRI